MICKLPFKAILARQLGLPDHTKELSNCQASLEEARTFPGRKRVIEAFEDELASFQYAIAAMQQLDRDYGMDSSNHIRVLKDFFQACREEIKVSRDALSTDLQVAMSGTEEYK